MRAAFLTKTGQFPSEIRSCDKPVPTKDQLLVRVHAASLNPVDLLIAGGHLPPAAPDLPAIPGLDFAGIVEAVGEAVTGFAVGDAVYGCAGGVKGRPGTFADYIAPEAALVAHKPRTLSMREAAAMPLVGITAWDGLVDRAALRADETVLIHGVTGGVSHAAIQIARSRGARVFATASSPEKAETARALGAVPIAYRTVPVADYVRDHTGGAGFDVVYDTVGGDVFEQSAQATRLYGRLVSCAAWQGHDLVPVLGHSLTLIGIFMLLPMLTGQGTARHGQILAALAALADTGALRPLLAERRFSLNEVGDAYALQAGGTAVGKIVIDIA